MLGNGPHKKGLAILAACLLAALAAIALPTDTRALAGESALFDVRFAAGLTPEDSATLLIGRGATIVELRHSYRAGDQVFTGGFFLSGQADAASIGVAYRREHVGIIQDLLGAQNALEAAVGSDAATASRRHALEIAVKAFERPVVFAAQVRADEAMVAELRQDGRVRDVTERQTRRTTHKSSPGALAAPTKSHLYRVAWVPDRIFVHAQPSASGGRYVSQDMTWYTSRSLGWMSDYDAFEADFFLSANDGTYMTTAEYAGEIPAVSAWSSTFPYGYFGDAPYLDTRAGDSDFEYAYTIGTPGAKYIQKGNWYNTYIRASNGSANTDWGRISPQYGQCAWTPCGTWSIFAHDTCYSTWSIPIPANQWLWDRVNGPHPCT